MKLSELIHVLNKANVTVGGEDPEVALCFEPSTLEEGFDWTSTEGISDVRLVSDWPLPGKSLVVEEHEKPSKLVIFYDNHFNLDSSKE
jgi:hypothetical protein